MQTQPDLSKKPHRLIELTWVSGDPGTRGLETVLAVERAPSGNGTQLKLSHAGFPHAESRDAHEKAWPPGLAHLDHCDSDVA